MTQIPTTPAPHRSPYGWALRVSVLIYAVLTVAYVVANRATPRPDASGAEVLRYAQNHGTAITWGAVLLIASAAALAGLTGLTYKFLRTTASTAASMVTLIAGLLAAVALTTSATFAWRVGALTSDADPAQARTLADQSFLFGGPAFAVTFALAIAGITMAGLSTGRLPRAVTWTGLILAAAGLLSSLTPLATGFGHLLPVVRFGGTIWLVFAAFLVSRSRD